MNADQYKYSRVCPVCIGTVWHPSGAARDSAIKKNRRCRKCALVDTGLYRQGFMDSSKMMGSGNPFYGKRHTEESIRQMAEAGRKRRHTEEAKQRMRENTPRGEANHMYGTSLC